MSELSETRSLCRYDVSVAGPQEAIDDDAQQAADETRLCNKFITSVAAHDWTR